MPWQGLSGKGEIAPPPAPTKRVGEYGVEKIDQKRWEVATGPKVTCQVHDVGGSVEHNDM